MKISVTQEDIDNGEKESYHSCPIALAIKRNLNSDYIAVGELFITNHKEIYYNTPRPALRFMNAFDKGKPVKPFNFILNS